MELKKKKYTVQGVDLLKIAKKFGSPVYVYDAEKIKKQHEHLMSSFSNVDIKLKYAMKALSNISILKYMRSLGTGLDAVSIQEVELGLKAGFTPKEIMYTPSGVDFAEIEEAIDLGCYH